MNITELNILLLPFIPSNPAEDVIVCKIPDKGQPKSDRIVFVNPSLDYRITPIHS